MQTIPIFRRTLKAHLKSALVPLAVGAVAFLVTSTATILNSFEEHLDVSSKILSDTLYASVAFQDKKEAARVLATLRGNPSVTGAYVVDENGVKFSEFGESFVGLKQAGAESMDSVLSLHSYSLRQAIELNGDRVGTLYLRASTGVLFIQLVEYLTVLFLTVALCVAISILRARSEATQISLPLRRLSAVLNAMQSEGIHRLGSKESAVETSLNAHQSITEIEELYRHFGSLVAELRKSFGKLEAVNSELEERVHLRTKELVLSSKMASLGEMAGGVAHEINNPLAIIRGKASFLMKLEAAGEVNQENLRGSLQKIVETADRIAKIVSGLRSFSRNAEKDPWQYVQLDQIVSDTLSLCAERFKHHGIELRVDAVPNLLLECRATQVSQVLLNLLNNAHDAIEKSGDRWVHLSFIPTADKIQMCVTDSGNGIPPAVADKLMMPFFTTKEVGKGTGLGLSISRGIVEDHGGTLSLDRACRNTRFVMDLPLRQTVPQGAAA